MTSLKEIDEIFSLYKKYGSCDYIGEEVSQIEHMIQAAMLAEEDNQPTKVILASLFHDIGHLIEHDYNNRNKWGAKNHEEIAFRYLKSKKIPEPIPTLVKGHVLAKRYLVSTRKNYYDKLSNASKQTLEEQGGKFSEEQCLNFKSHPFSKYMIKIREYDDKAKVKNKPIISLNYYKYLLIRYMEQRQAQDHFH